MAADTAARFLAVLAEYELAGRDMRRIRRHLTEAQLPAGKTLATFDFKALPSCRAPGWTHTSNDNPFSEAYFKTLKYQPEFPKRFQTIDEARTFCRRFFAWYNEGHHHAGIGLMTPDQIHFGQVDAIQAARQTALDAAVLNTPERSARQRLKPPQIPTAVWINPPRKTEPAQA